MLLAREEHAQSRCSEGEGKSDRAEDVSAETRIRSAEDASAETSSDASRPSRADAMVALAESYLAGNTGTGNGGERFQVMVHLDQDPLAASSPEHWTTAPAFPRKRSEECPATAES